jgi:hypothetical protein
MQRHFCGEIASSRHIAAGTSLKLEAAAHRQVFFAPMFAEIRVGACKVFHRPGDEVAGGGNHRFSTSVGTAERFGNDGVDDLQLQKILGSDLHIGRRILRARGVAPESLDHEVRAFNIRVSVIEPAFVRTVFDQNGIEPDSVLKEYDQARAGVDALLRDVMPKADRPEVVADVVVKAATDARPRRRYTAGKAARQVSVLRRFAPAEIFDKTLRKQFRLPV